MTVFIIKAAIQIILLTIAYYYIYIALSQNMATQLVKTAMMYLLIYMVCLVTELDILSDLLGKCAIPFAVFLCVLYQPELRRTFAPGFGRRNRFFRLGAQTSAEQIDNILDACRRLVQSRRGALIVFPRRVPIKSIIDSGTKINADISSNLIVTVFDHDTPLHDGAMIVQGSKIVAAGCYLPLSGQTDIRESFGTRHRAALGMAEESDAIVLVVSEETGAISLAYGGNLFYQLTDDVIKSTLLALFNNLDSNEGKSPEEMNEAK